MPIPICCWTEKIKAGILCRDRIFCTLAEARVFFCKKIIATAGKRVFVANIVFSGIISNSEKKDRSRRKNANAIITHNYKHFRKEGADYVKKSKSKSKVAVSAADSA